MSAWRKDQQLRPLGYSCGAEGSNSSLKMLFQQQLTRDLASQLHASQSAVQQLVHVQLAVYIHVRVMKVKLSGFGPRDHGNNNINNNSYKAPFSNMS